MTQERKKLTSIFVSHAVALVLAITPTVSASVVQEEDSSPVVATFEGGRITRLDMAARTYFAFARQLNVPLAQAESLVAESTQTVHSSIRTAAFVRLVSDLARSRGFSPDPDQTAAIQTEKLMLSYRVYYDEVLKSITSSSLVRWRQEAREALAEHSSEYPPVSDQYWFRFIFVGDPGSTAPISVHEYRPEAEKARERALKDFLGTARQFSKSKPDYERGEVIGPVSGDAMTSERLEIMRKLKPGEVSQPFASRRGYMIVKLEHFVAAHAVDEEEASASLVQKGYVRRYMPERVINEHHDALVQAQNPRIFSDRFSNEPSSGSVVIASCDVAKVTNSEVFTRQFRAVNPEWEPKDVEGAINKLLLLKIVEAQVDSIYAARNPLYRKAIKIAEDEALTQAFLQAEQSENTVLFLKQCAKRECLDTLLDQYKFKLVE